MDKKRLVVRVLGRARGRTGREEIHLREMNAPDLPVMLDLAAYSASSDEYYLNTPFPDDPDLLREMIRILEERLEQHKRGML